MKDFEEDKNLKKQVQLGIEEGIELNHLKKVNKKMNLLRNIILSIVFIIVIILLVLIFRYNRVNNILNKSYDKLKTVSKSNNYQLIIQETEYNYNTNLNVKAETKSFYKDGKYKDEWNVIDNDTFKETPYSTTSYYTDTDSYRITVFHNLKTVEDSTNIYKDLFKQMVKNKLIIVSPILSYADLKGFYNFYKLGLNVRTDYFNNEECYIIRSGSEDKGYREVWISKESYLVIREIESYDAYYREYTYSLVFDQVTDEDVDSSNLSEIYSDYEIKLGGRN